MARATFHERNPRVFVAYSILGTRPAVGTVNDEKNMVRSGSVVLDGGVCHGSSSARVRAAP